MSGHSVALPAVRARKRKRRPMTRIERTALRMVGFHAALIVCFLCVALLATPPNRWIGFGEVCVLLFWAWIPVRGNPFRIVINSIINGWTDERASETIVHIEGPSIDGVPVPAGRGVEITAERQDLGLYLQERHEIARPLRLVAYLTFFARGRYHRGPPLYRGRVTGNQDGNMVDFDCATGEGVITVTRTCWCLAAPPSSSVLAFR